MLTGLGLAREERVLLCLLDTIDFPSAFLGAIKAGIVPVAGNTLLTTKDYEYMLRDSRAGALVVSAALYPAFAPLIGKLPDLRHVVVADATDEHAKAGHHSLAGLMKPRGHELRRGGDDVRRHVLLALFVGVHRRAQRHRARPVEPDRDGRALCQADPRHCARSDVVFSAAKLFFAYGLGNGLTFPLAVGATTMLMAERPTPAAVFARLRKHQPTIFYGVPTLFAALLASPDLPKRGELTMRRCTSAGEALPADIGRRWTEHFGVEILDGLGSTEMLHIFLSNRPGRSALRDERQAGPRLRASHRRRQRRTGRAR